MSMVQLICILAGKSGIVDMITFDQFKQCMNYESQISYCIEVLFSVGDIEKYNLCWMGKIFDPKLNTNEYWYGLTSDGSNAYDYDNFDTFINSEVFEGRSLREIWDDVNIIEIDGCDPEDRIEFYLQ